MTTARKPRKPPRRATSPAKLTRTLRTLSDSVLVFLSLIDEEMKKPSSFQRGRRIGDLCSRLEYANDTVRHFTLNLPIDKKAKATAVERLVKKATRILDEMEKQNGDKQG